MQKNQSQEDYLEAILMVRKMQGRCRSIDVARHLGFSKPSVSIAVSKLIDDGYVMKEARGELVLTDPGMERASKVLERHEFLRKFLMKIGVSDEVANHDACLMEHILTEESFRKLQEYANENMN